MEEYKGYKIVKNTKTIWHKNKVSGHEWLTQEDVNGFHVIGKGIWSDFNFSTIEKAKEHIDFVLKFKLGDEIPRS